MMKATRSIVATAALLMLTAAAPAAGSAQTADESAVRAVVQAFFDAMRSRDENALRATSLPEARLVNPIRRADSLSLRIMSMDRLAEAVLRTPEPYDERMPHAEVRIDTDLATVWGRYTFRVGSRLTNCGMNAVQLVRTGAGWRIAQFASTIETAGCETTGESSLSLRFDYAAVESILSMLERDAVSDGALDSLLAVHGVRRMIENVTHYVPAVGASEYRAALRDYVRTRQRGTYNGQFEIDQTWQRRTVTRELVASIRADESAIAAQALRQIEPYQPETGPVEVSVYFVAGGVSDGFLFDDATEQAFYANLTRANGDYDGVVGNVAHEAYHVLQKVAQRRAGLTAIADSTMRLPEPERLLAITLAEGTAAYVTDPTKTTGGGASTESFRARFRRNATPERIRENFALFDSVLSQLEAGILSWQDAYRAGFSGNNDARFYFVGHEMARAIEDACGRSCIGDLFSRHPVEFFRRYIALYRADRALVGRFSPASEAIIESIGRDGPAAARDVVPLVDHHQHLVSPGTAAMINARMRAGGTPQEPITADRLVALLDSAGIRRAVVLSGAFTFGGFNFDPERATLSAAQIDARVSAENDWTARQVERYPDRLIGFCSFHPQSESALAELRRCSAMPAFRGIKLHLEESNVDLTDSAHVEALRRVFAEANRLRLPIVVHPGNNRVDARAATESFLVRVLPAAPDVPVQIAHLHGGGRYSEAALALYADAIAAGRPATRNLIFDVTDIALTAAQAGERANAVMRSIAGHMRRIGMERMLYGSDPAVFGRLAPREGWELFRRVMPLTEAEFATIATNVAPYVE